MSSCNNCKELLMKKLCDIPSAWRSQIVDVLCDANKGLEISPESLTSLSEWNVSRAPEVCITYLDEQGVHNTKCFDFSYLLNQRLEQLDPKCIVAPEVWNSLNDIGKFQAIIDKLCTACFDPNTVISGTTTTTTTVAPTTSSLVYHGAKDTADVQLSDVQTTTPVTISTSSITIDWTSFNSAPEYLWFASSSIRTHWQDSLVLINNGAIGSLDDLFGPPTTIIISGNTYYLYVTMYPTQVVNPITIS